MFATKIYRKIILSGAFFLLSAVPIWGQEGSIHFEDVVPEDPASKARPHEVEQGPWGDRDRQAWELFGDEEDRWAEAQRDPQHHGQDVRPVAGQRRDRSPRRTGLDANDRVKKRKLEAFLWQTELKLQGAEAGNLDRDTVHALHAKRKALKAMLAHVHGESDRDVEDQTHVAMAAPSRERHHARLRHLHQAMEHLAAAGLEQEVQHVRAHAERLERQMQPRDDRPAADHVRGMMEHMHASLREIHSELQRLHRRIDQLEDRDDHDDDDEAEDDREEEHERAHHEDHDHDDHDHEHDHDHDHEHEHEHEHDEHDD